MLLEYSRTLGNYGFLLSERSLDLSLDPVDCVGYNEQAIVD
jgi:hypothetical protein